MILKVLLLVGVIVFVYFMFFKKKPQVSDLKKKSQADDMVECKQCGIYCELDDAILSNNKYYCSQECLKRS